MPSYAEGAVLGMSGGVDSSLVAYLTKHAFELDGVHKTPAASQGTDRRALFDLQLKRKSV